MLRPTNIRSCSVAGLAALLAALASLLLSAGCGGGSSDAAAPAPAPAPAPNPAPGGSAYFYFSSNNDALSVLTGSDAKAKLATYSSVIAGVDAGGDTQSADLVIALQHLRSVGFRLHVYLEGPGGPTGSAWSADECARIHAAAKQYVNAIIPPSDTCQDDSASWMIQWNDAGFFKQLQQQLVDLNAMGVESVEVDNLYRAGYGPGLKPVSDFVTRFQSGRPAGSSIKLLLKNLGSASEVDAILSSVSRPTIADFMIVEEDFKPQWCSIAKASKRYGVNTVFSWDTNNYHAEGDTSGRDLRLAGPVFPERITFGCS
jgi:hypothetical protein